MYFCLIASPDQLDNFVVEYTQSVTPGAGSKSGQCKWTGLNFVSFFLLSGNFEVWITSSL